MTVRRRNPRLILSLLLLSTCLWAAPGPAQTTSQTYHARANAALESFLLKFWNGSRQYLRNWYPSDGSLTGYWTYAHGWDAVMDGVERTKGLQYSGFIESLYLGQDQAGWYSDYFDDECWMTLALLRAWELTSEPKYLAKAQTLYADIMTGWDTSCCGSTRGGLWWDKARTQKATAANAGAALAGACLYRLTGNTPYLTFAQQVYTFWYANMVNTSTGQVCDHMNPDGTKVWWRFTYNEGLMIGASLQLFDATGTAGYLNNAHRIAAYMVAHEVTSTVYGPVLFDGNNTGCGGDCHEFKGPAYRYLAALFSRDTSKTQYCNVLRASAEAAWNLARDTNATTFAVNWAGPSQTPVDQAQENAACIALNLFAMLQGGYSGSGIPPNQYEAENGVLHKLGVEASYGPFTGWGYMAAWNADGQSVDFKVNCATAGPHTLRFRYAAGAGAAYRTIRLNGMPLANRQAFAATGSWANYSTVSLAYNLPAGPSTISLSFESAQSSANWLNLDNLVVEGDPEESIRILGIQVLSANSVRVSWNSRPRHIYGLQSCSDPASDIWTDEGDPIIAEGAVTTIDRPTVATASRFYRVRTFY